MKNPESKEIVQNTHLESIKNKNLMLVDDHEMILIGLKNFLESKTDWKVTGEARNINSAKKILKNYNILPYIIVIDIELGEESGFDLAAFVQENYPSIKIIMYTMHDGNDYVLKAKQTKIDGYVSKASDSDEFLKCIDSVYNGNDFLENRLKKGQALLDETLSLLTKRETLIFQEMLNGYSNEEISKILNVSKHSVEVYATIIYEKTFCKNRSEFLKKFR